MTYNVFSGTLNPAQSINQSGREPLSISGVVFVWAVCPSCHPAISVRALKRTQCTDHNQWPGLILSSSTDHNRTSN